MPTPSHSNEKKKNYCAAQIYLYVSVPKLIYDDAFFSFSFLAGSLVDNMYHPTNNNKYCD